MVVVGNLSRRQLGARADVVPVAGTMMFCDLYPDGTAKYYSYGFATPGYKYRWFNATKPGRYITMLTIADIPSGYIIIDVL